MEKFLWAFIVGGAILGGLELYEPLVKLAGVGASVPISSFRNSLIKGAMKEVEKSDVIGVLTGIFHITSAGISSALIFPFLASLIFKPKE